MMVLVMFFAHPVVEEVVVVYYTIEYIAHPVLCFARRGVNIVMTAVAVIPQRKTLFPPYLRPHKICETSKSQRVQLFLQVSSSCHHTWVKLKRVSKVFAFPTMWILHLQLLYVSKKHQYHISQRNPHIRNAYIYMDIGYPKLIKNILQQFSISWTSLCLHRVIKLSKSLL